MIQTSRITSLPIIVQTYFRMTAQMATLPSKMDNTSVEMIPGNVQTLEMHRRLAFGRKHLFSTPGSSSAKYFITNPIPYKHANTWKPILYQGDNPKYTESSKPISRARRTSMWRSFKIEMGYGVEQVLENERRVKEKKDYERTQRWRKRFGMKPTLPQNELAEVQEVDGFIQCLEMKRSGFLTRSLEWNLDDQENKWIGTRSFMTGWLRRVRGISHDIKVRKTISPLYYSNTASQLINKQGLVMATFEKDRWATFKRSKTNTCCNKRTSLVGTLHIYHPTTVRSPKQSSDLIEEAIVFTCWMAIEADHRLRHSIIDTLIEIAEEFHD